MSVDERESLSFSRSFSLSALDCVTHLEIQFGNMVKIKTSISIVISILDGDIPVADPEFPIAGRQPQGT